MKALAALVSGLLLAALPTAGQAGPLPGVPVVDLNVGLPSQLVSKGYGIEWGAGQASADRMRRGGVYGVVLELGGRSRPSDEQSLTRDYLAVQRALARSTELRLPGCNRKRPGVRTWLSLADSSSIAGSPAAAKLWATRGVRLFGLISRADSALATSARTPEPVLTGLTEQGREVVTNVHRAGGIIDISRASPMTFRDVIEMARADGKPVVATHAAARAIADEPTNLTDGQLRDIASTGGVVGLSLHEDMLTRGREATLRDVVQHVRHLVKIAGPDHVAIGSGYASIHPPNALRDASRFPRLVTALEASGVPRRTVRKVFATNALRLLCP